MSVNAKTGFRMEKVFHIHARMERVNIIFGKANLSVANLIMGSIQTDTEQVRLLAATVVAAIPI